LGEKFIPRVRLWPGAITTGNEGAVLSWKLEPVTLIRETVMFEPSVAVLLTTTELEPVPPTGTVPNCTIEAAFN
jgi:hypothetical protein